MVVTFRPIGGLGNQLFIWATAYALAKLQGQPLIADLHHYGPGAKRDYGLEGFDAGISGTYGRRPSGSKLLSRIPGKWALPLGYVSDKTPGNPLVWQRGRRLYLEGYFHDPVHFVNLRSDISARVHHITGPSQWFLETRKRLLNSGPFLGVHVRRGDYVPLARFGALPHRYYASCLDHLAVSHPRISHTVVFSDSPKSLQASAFFAKGGTGEVISPPSNSHPIESLVLMSLAQSLVMANSTFSWWAAFIGNPEAVFFPDPWFRDSRLVTPGWLPENSVAVGSGFGDTENKEP